MPNADNSMKALTGQSCKLFVIQRQASFSAVASTVSHVFYIQERQTSAVASLLPSRLKTMLALHEK